MILIISARSMLLAVVRAAGWMGMGFLRLEVIPYKMSRADKRRVDAPGSSNRGTDGNERRHVHIPTYLESLRKLSLISETVLCRQCVQS